MADRAARAVTSVTAIGTEYLAPPVRGLRQSRLAVALAEARTCYDHLAGRAGVELLDAMLREGILVEDAGPGRRTGNAGQSVDVADTRYTVTRPGMSVLGPYGIKIDSLLASRRRFAPACLDWTQRRPHLGGVLGAAITTRLFELGWIERGPRLRSVVITAAGREGLAATFGWSRGAANDALG
jgi:hypothetical protein